MSLILEALRKSEAERRRGQAPDLRTELPPVAPPRAQVLPPWSWAVFAVALLGLAWLLLARPGAAPSNDALPADAAAAVASTAPAGNSAAGPAAEVGSGLPERGIVIDPPPAAPPQENAPAPGQDPASAPMPPIASGSGPVPASAGGSGASAPSSPAAPPPPAQSAPQPTAPAPPATAMSGTGLLSLPDLSAEERRQLPPLKLSMHMWSEDPARRFVILDGQRLAEGDRAGPAVVDEIRSDDVVLAWNGMRLRLSLR
jgi:general secretion pathway protein B